MSDFTRTVRLGTVSVGARNASVFCKITFKDGKLSISGVEGPLPSGNCLGGCGQIDMHLTADSFAKFAPGWSRDTAAQFFAAWGEWHLNDMCAGTPDQEAFIRANPVQRGVNDYERTIAALSAAGLNPDANGYRYGSAWLRKEVPDDVLTFLRGLPETDRAPAWV